MLSATYDDTLSRVRITGDPFGDLNTNPGFENGVSGWVGLGGSVVASTTHVRTGTGAARLTPTGSDTIASLNQTLAASPEIAVGTDYTATAWVYVVAGWSAASATIAWTDTVGNILELAAGPNTTVPANTWTRVTVTDVAPAGAVKGAPRVRLTGTPPATAVTWIDDVTFFAAGNVDVTVERSLNQVTWTPVRGGTRQSLDPLGALAVDDYEFAAGVPNFYRVTLTDDVSHAIVLREILEITPTMNAVWLKSVLRPFLNRPVAVVDMGTLSRPARSATFPVIGRRLPISISGVRGGRTFDLTLLTDDRSTRESLGLLLDTGDPLFVHVPPSCPIPIPTIHAVVGDVADDRPARVTEIHTLTLPLTEVAAPGPDVIGSTIMWSSIVSQFDTWTELQDACATWGDVLELIGDPTDVVVD